MFNFLKKKEKADTKKRNEILINIEDEQLLKSLIKIKQTTGYINNIIIIKKALFVYAYLLSQKDKGNDIYVVNKEQKFVKKITLNNHREK